MPFQRPTLSELIARNAADINARLIGADAQLRRSVLNVLARMHAAATHGLYGYLDFIARQVFPDSAEQAYLERWGAIYNVLRKEASKTIGQGTATGINGVIIPDGSELLRSDGKAFVAQGDVMISDGTATVIIQATEAGDDSNTAGGVTLSFVSPPSGINSNVVLDSNGLTGGADIEDDDGYRPRVLARIQLPPHGGADFDYKSWALEVPGATRVWVYPKELGAGTVTVRFMMDDVYPDGIPQAADVAIVQAYLDDIKRRPVTAEVFVVAPIAAPLNFTIHLNVNDTANIRAAVEAELRDVLRRDAVPSGTIYLSRLQEAISIATGEFAHVLISPSANIVNTTGLITTFGSITWS